MCTLPATFGTRLQGKALEGEIYWEKVLYTTPETYPCYVKKEGKHSKHSILVHHDSRILTDTHVTRLFHFLLSPTHRNFHQIFF